MDTKSAENIGEELAVMKRLSPEELKETFEKASVANILKNIKSLAAHPAQVFKLSALSHRKLVSGPDLEVRILSVKGLLLLLRLLRAGGGREAPGRFCADAGDAGPVTA